MSKRPDFRAARGLLLTSMIGICCLACTDPTKFIPEALSAKPQPLIDEDYRFRLETPGASWKLMRQQEIQKLSPDAIAGAVDLNGGLFGVIIVEPAPDVPLDDFARLVAENMALENKQVGAFVPMDFHGAKAMRFSVQGQAEGVPIRFFNQLFIHSGHAYQLLAWGMTSRVDSQGRSLQAFYDAFSLLPGPVQGRSVQRAILDSSGVGWQVRDGVFESVIQKIRVEPAEPFRLVVGGELSRMNAAAEIGLSSDSAYLILIAEQVGSVDRKAYADKLHADTLSNMNGSRHGEPLQVEIDGRKLEMVRMRNAGQPTFEYLHGVMFEDNRAIQILIWYLLSLEPQAEEILPAALASIRFLDEPELSRLRQQLSRAPDAQNRVGPDFSLRRGVYRDFAHGMLWRKPPGFWRISVGQQARLSNREASLFIEEAALGIFGMLLIEPSANLTGQAYHELLKQQVFAGAEPKSLTSRSLEIDGKEGLQTQAHKTVNDLRLQYRIVSWILEGHAFQFHFWGVPEAMQAAEGELKAALAGIELPGASLRAETTRGQSRSDLRFGYRFSPPGEGWSLSDLSPPELRAIGQVLDWKKGDKHVLLVSVCALEPGQDRDWFIDLASQIMRQRMAGLSIISPSRAELEHAGIRWDHLAWRGAGKADAILATRDKTFYAIMSASDFFIGLDPKKVVAGFSFLD